MISREESVITNFRWICLADKILSQTDSGLPLFLDWGWSEKRLVFVMAVKLEEFQTRIARWEWKLPIPELSLESLMVCLEHGLEEIHKTGLLDIGPGAELDLVNQATEGFFEATQAGSTSV